MVHFFKKYYKVIFKIIFFIGLIYLFPLKYFPLDTFRVIQYIFLNPVFWILVTGPTILSNQDLSLVRNIDLLNENDIKDYLESKETEYKKRIEEIDRILTIKESSNWFKKRWYSFKSIEDYKSVKNKLSAEINDYKKLNKGSKSKIEEEIDSFTSVLNKNRVAYAWNDLNNQLLVTILSLIFSFIVAVSSILELLNESIHNFNCTLSIVFNDRYTSLIYLLMIILTIYIVFFEFLSRQLFSIKEFFIYINPDTKSRGVKFPPKSKLTFLRGLIIIYAVLFMVWKLFWFGKVLEQLI